MATRPGFLFYFEVSSHLLRRELGLLSSILRTLLANLRGGKLFLAKFVNFYHLSFTVQISFLASQEIHRGLFEKEGALARCATS